MMRKTIMACVAGLMMATGCSLETSDNGSLDGFWQMTAVDSLYNGRSADMRESGFYWSVQVHLLEMRNFRQGLPSLFFRFERTGDGLVLRDPVYNERLTGDSLVTDLATVGPYGLTSLPDTFRILTLSDGRMTLQARTLRMYFRKY